MRSLSRLHIAAQNALNGLEHDSHALLTRALLFNQSSFISGMTERKPAMHKSNTHSNSCVCHGYSYVILVKKLTV